MGRMLSGLSILEMRGFVLPEQITSSTIITVQLQHWTEPSRQMWNKLCQEKQLLRWIFSGMHTEYFIELTYFHSGQIKHIITTHSLVHWCLRMYNFNHDVNNTFSHTAAKRKGSVNVMVSTPCALWNIPVFFFIYFETPYLCDLVHAHTYAHALWLSAGFNK